MNLDYLVSFFIWALAVFGMSNIIVFSTFFKPMRDWTTKKIPFIGKLVSCILCTGFWAGVFFGLTIWSPADLLYLRIWDFHTIRILDWLFNGCLGSSVTWITFLLIRNRMNGL